MMSGGSRTLLSAFLVLHSLLFPYVLAHPTPSIETRQGTFGGSWHHPEDHPVHALFRRQTSASLQVGSSAWYAQYPSGTPDVNTMPQAWQDALTALENSGGIPDIVLTTGQGVYPSGTSGASKTVCNSAAMCRAPGDVWDAPDGMLGVSFDDGPTTSSPALYDFLKQNGQKATHFMIGQNILANPKIFLQAFANGDDIGCHTWTHPFMTIKTNAQVVSEFGWSLQIISDLTGGRIPRYWRPPYGDADNRVRAIATKMFGMTLVDWNQDTGDWQIGNNKITPAQIAAELKKFISGPKSPGLIILEHELYPQTVQAFIDAYPLMKSEGWDTRSIPDLFGESYYLNSFNDNGTVIPLSIASAGATSINLSAPATSTAASSTSSPSSAPASTASQNSAATKSSAELRIPISPPISLALGLGLPVAALFLLDL